MRRFSRVRRRRVFALALTPVVVMTIGVSPAFSQETQAAVITGQNAVKFGNDARLRGQFPGARHAILALEYRRSGRASFRQVAQLRTDGSGRWQKRVKPSVSGVWRARLIDAPSAQDETIPTADADRSPAVDRETDAKRVRVRSVTRVRATTRTVVAGSAVKIRGRVRPGGRRRIKIKTAGRTIKTRTNRAGRFQVRAGSLALGRHKVRAIAASNRDATWSKDRGGRFTVYRYAHASWYGPGLYGNRTACGQTLTAGIVGVAHKTLPCGTRVTFRHAGNVVTAPVIDRGPYVAGREWDLTSALRNKLGFGDTGAVMSTK